MKSTTGIVHAFAIGILWVVPGLVTAASSNVTLLVYETKSEDMFVAQRFADQAAQIPGLSAKIFGQGQLYEGYGSKYSALLPVLQNMSSRSLVVLSDGRDVLINMPSSTSSKIMQKAVANFNQAFADLTAHYPNAVVVSTEARCCVTALTHIAPGECFAQDGSRRKRTCSSGKAGCLWNGDDKAAPWVNFTETMARKRRNRPSGDDDDIYLNAGLVAGMVQDLILLIKAIDIDNQEDDQAVLTNYMYHNHDAIVLDYDRRLFGTGHAFEPGIGCHMFQFPNGGIRGQGQQRLVHTKTGASPLFIHSPGNLVQCHEELAGKLGLEQVSNATQLRLLAWKTKDQVSSPTGFFGWFLDLLQQFFEKHGLLDGKGRSLIHLSSNYNYGNYNYGNYNYGNYNYGPPPTKAPSPAPTSKPSSSPSETPSQAPSLKPSSSPSATPSETPSQAPTLPFPRTKNDCKKNGWKDLYKKDDGTQFKNQGDCVSYVTSKGKQ